MGMARLGKGIRFPERTTTPKTFRRGKAWLGAAEHGAVRSGTASRGAPSPVDGPDNSRLSSLAGHGTARCGGAGRGGARLGLVRGSVLQGADQNFRLSAGQGTAWYGRARPGEVGRGGVRHGVRLLWTDHTIPKTFSMARWGMARRGMVWHGAVRRGSARCGEDSVLQGADHTAPDFRRGRARLGKARHGMAWPGPAG